ncbi:MAG: outer membrane protein assembly factor BamD, partial [Candidatus Dadabacteria bacterium]
MVKKRKRKIILLFFLLVLGFYGTSCSLFSSEKKDVLKEVPLVPDEVADKSDKELFEEGRDLFEVGSYIQARQRFKQLASAYPLSAYRKLAEIKAADCTFNLRSYAEAAKQYEELMHKYKGEEEAAYLTFQAARSYQLLNRGVGRDVSSIRKAVKLYKALIKKYPSSGYVEAAKERLAKALKHLEKYEEDVANFYKEQNKKKAALKREERALFFKKEHKDVLKIKVLPREQIKSPPRLVKALRIREAVESSSYSRKKPVLVRSILCEEDPVLIKIFFYRELSFKEQEKAVNNFVINNGALRIFLDGKDGRQFRCLRKRIQFKEKE